jgi:hypothetical protein
MFHGVAAPLTLSKMITIENRSAVRMDGALVGYIPAERWQKALLALGATGGFRREDPCPGIGRASYEPLNDW